MKPGRRPLPVRQAIWLFDQLKSWPKVRLYLRRPDGTLFTYSGLIAAVRRYDLGKAK